jgi:hypothetical protein
MSTPRTPAALAAALAVAVLAAACGSSGGPGETPNGSPGSTPGSTPGATPDATGIGYPTGATDVILRMDEGGGFMQWGYSAVQTPVFTLYGDGTIIFRPNTWPEPRADGVIVQDPLRTARLAPDQVQELLRFALGAGGLGIAKARYENPMVADAGTTTFFLHVDDGEKTVSAYALGMEGEPGPDSQVLRALSELAERLRDFDRGGAFSSAAYAPERYRGSLLESTPDMPLRPWPWADLAPADFETPADPQHPVSYPHRTLTPDEAAALDIENTQGGVHQVFLAGPDGKAYMFVLRPLLPDEAE